MPAALSHYHNIVEGYGACHTRMIGQWNLPALHAMLSAGLPESTCSLLRRTYPNDRNVESVNSTRGAGSRPAKRQMLSHFLPTTQPFFPHYPIIIRIWGYGALPHDYPSPLTSPTYAIANQLPCPRASIAGRAFLSFGRGRPPGGGRGGRERRGGRRARRGVSCAVKGR